jgi:hypothetical protein
MDFLVELTHSPHSKQIVRGGKVQLVAGFWNWLWLMMTLKWRLDDDRSDCAWPQASVDRSLVG